MTQTERLLRFARLTLQILQEDKEWSADTTDAISGLAFDLDLAETDEFHEFKHKWPMDKELLPADVLLEIPRSRFENEGFRTVELARGSVLFGDKTTCKFNVRLMADPGTEGDIRIIVEDINRSLHTDHTYATLNRKLYRK